MNNDSVQPAIWYYGLAVLIVIIGFAAFAMSIYSGISNAESSLLQMLAPGGAELTLSEPGEYIVFYEDKSYFSGKYYSTDEQISGLKVSVREKSTGVELTTYPTKGTFTYSLGGRSGRSIMAFYIKQAGVYQFNASYAESAGPQVVLATGKGMLERLLTSVLISLGLLFGSIAIAAAITFVTYTRRKKALLRQKEEERQLRGLA